MASILITSLYAVSQDVTTQEALSGIFGSVSLATWIFLLVRDDAYSSSSCEKAVLSDDTGSATYSEL